MDVRFSNGRYVKRFYKKYGFERNETRVALQAQNLCTALAALSDSVTQTIERNTRMKVMNISLEFL